MKWTQNSESRAAELPFLLWCEFSSTVIAYYDQPEAIKISYRNKHGKKVTHLETPDFLVVRKDGVHLVECKKVSFLEKAVVDNPNRFIKTAQGYASPPAVAAANELGLKHVISTDRDFTPVFTRNCIFLLNFIDDLKIHDEIISEKVVQAIRRSGNRLRLNDINDAFPQPAVIQALFHSQIFVDLNAQLLCQPEFVWVYYDRTYMDAVNRLTKEEQLVAAVSIRQLKDSPSVWWQGAEWEVLNVNDYPNVSLTIRGESRLVTLTDDDLTQAFSLQEIYVKDSRYLESLRAENILCSYKAHQIDEALTRQAILKRPPEQQAPVSARTLNRWKKSAKLSSDPLIGLISKKDQRGNRESRLIPEVLDLINQHIEKTLLQPSPPSTYKVYGDFKADCDKLGLTACSLNAFYKRVNKIDVKYRILKQQGFRASYALGPEPREIDLNWDLPYHGDFIFEVVHVDHTPVEMTLVSKITGEPLEGTLNLSTLYDGHSRKILAVYISFEKPSYRATMMLLRECYRRYSRLPLFLVADHGPDFKSNYFDATISDLGMHKRRRPKCASRHGSIIERVFGTTESELIHCLKGNKQLQKLGRGQSTSHHSSKRASWTPDTFNTALKDYAYLRHPHIARRGISETAQSRWDRSLSTFDECPGTKIKSEVAFILATLPNAHSKDGCRTLTNNQLHFNNVDYLLSVKVPGYSGKKCRIPVKFDPYDISYIWGKIENRWVKLTTNDVIVRECHDKGVQLAHMEVYSRKLRHGRRYRQGPKTSVTLHHHEAEAEHNQFNIGQSLTTTTDRHEDAYFSPETIDFDSLELLPSTRLSKGEHDE
ncbi:DDE-type integrase/transposase/recombinase [Gilvimarinus agarilyticus]|uniref:TnsA endonuclease N-terminal domain-containing protein n=1 Tax=Gilvimarinus sp. 2_MG-2023 TaxID=3062666 RepID=UPI001C0A1BB7|nr:TnsA endonuclease N-terminal domain-containing protein [Gilvimarinus sp. 2_MG-2023]MBU2886758.1 DDE-type integrase/transposase/recombinase [Gilvimarinus agarilyticus]MDO6571424.1 DDE-type integrase/transposase/recombinase [Gilvimarinus sp. 2_MG-2023]